MPTKTKKRKSPTKKYSRTGQVLTATIYGYVEPANRRYAVKKGATKRYGTISAYLNALIAQDRGVKPATGTKNQRVTTGKLLQFNRAKRTVTLGRKAA